MTNMTRQLAANRSPGKGRRPRVEGRGPRTEGRESSAEGRGPKAVRPRAELPAEVEDYRDLRWRREGTRQVETAYEAERFIEQAGFIACLSDSRRPGPSLYVA